MNNVRITAIALATVIALSALSTSAFTTADLSRDTNIDVVQDDKGIIALSDGTSGGIVSYDSDGSLSIDFDPNQASGVNVNSTYKLGDPNDANSSMAFNITNQDSVSHTINVSYSVSSGDGSGSSNATEFQIYDSSNTHVVTISEDDSGREFSLSSGSTVHVVVVVDTTAKGITSSEDLSGSFNVTAT